MRHGYNAIWSNLDILYLGFHYGNIVLDWNKVLFTLLKEDFFLFKAVFSL